MTGTLLKKNNKPTKQLWIEVWRRGYRHNSFPKMILMMLNWRVACGAAVMTEAAMTLNAI